MEQTDRPIYKWLFRNEKFLFFFFVAINLYPVFFFNYFVTVDGPAHIYNSNLIFRLLFDNHSFFDRFFYFNHNPEPNWIGHLILAFFNSFLPSFFAEKIILVLYITSFAYLFRALVLCFKPYSVFLIWLIFPFIHNISLYFGFYNFLLSISLLFFTLRWWIIKQRSLTLKNILVLSLLLLLVYFGHLFSLLVQIFMLFIFSFSKENELYGLKQRFILLFTSAIPCLILILNFFLRKGMEGYKGKVVYLSGHELWQWLTDVRVLICYVYDDEKKYTTCMGALLLLLICLIIFVRIRNALLPKKNIALNARNIFNISDFWFIIASVTLILFLVLPDAFASGGFVSFRILLFFFIFLILWIALQKLPKIICVFSAAVSVLISLLLLFYHFPIAKQLSKDASEYTSCLTYIQPYKTVLPLNYSDNWLHLNISNYAGADKPVVILDNYEGTYPQFPLRWNEKTKPYDKLGNFASSRRPCITIDNYEKNSGVQIDYIARWRYDSVLNDSCTIFTNRQIDSLFKLVFVSENKKLELFKKKFKQ